jgi:hypothetical protein
VARLEGVGRDYPLSIEKLCPILAFYEVDGAEAGTARCLELLRFGGTGHTVGIHSRDDKVIRAFAAREPVYRVIVNTQTSMGATGYTTGLAPSMSLGCGAFAGNITSDNITPLHLINVKRVAYVRPRDPAAAAPKPPAPAPSAASPQPASAGAALAFVCEDDVKRALREGRVLRVAARAIVTPAARDAAEGTSVLAVEA